MIASYAKQWCTQRTVTLNAGTANLVAPSDIKRIVIMIGLTQSPGFGTASIGIKPTADPLDGWPVAVNIIQTFTRELHGRLPSEEWWSGSTGATAVSVVEVFEYDTQAPVSRSAGGVLLGDAGPLAQQLNGSGKNLYNYLRGRIADAAQELSHARP